MVRLPLSRSGAAGFALALAGCTCALEAPPSARPAPSPPPTAAGAWIDPPAGLEPLTPATRVTLSSGRVEVGNSDLLGTWPPDALARARAAAEGEGPEWPRLALRLDAPPRGERDFPALVDALRRARRAERAATGAGSGAGVFDVRPRSSVPFEDLERVLYAGSRAGYGEARLALGPDGALRGFEWPRAAPAAAPTEAEIRAAVEAIGRGEEPALVAPDDRRVAIALDAEGVATGVDCAAPGEPAALGSCVRGQAVTLRVDASAPLGRVVPIVVPLARASSSLRVVSRR